MAGTPELAWFVSAGAEAVASMREALGRQGIRLDELGALLDFGCGCGRVARSFATHRGGIAGCDANPAGVRWCRRHLPFGRWDVNRLAPPLPYAAGSFDLVYALSVFTHLPADLQRSWLEELHRVLRPGGWLLISVHGDRYAAELDARERARFEAGELVVRRGEDAGSNLCGAYHPAAAVPRLAAGLFEQRERLREGARGNPHQDLVVLRRA